jgi:hypothetical protein
MCANTLPLQCLVLETSSHCVAQADVLELMIFLLLPSGYWDYKCARPYWSPISWTYMLQFAYLLGWIPFPILYKGLIVSSLEDSIHNTTQRGKNK